MLISRFFFITVAIIISFTEVSRVNAKQVHRQIIPVRPIPPQLMNLDLTPDQQEQFQNIQQETYAQIMSVLSPSQQEKFRQSLERRESLVQVLPTLSLSPEQRLKVKQIIQTQEQKVQHILTSKQKQKLKQFIGPFRSNSS